tara:strand:+ start:50 stop:286 length:237 start_codon:yes stop_codon:yes gene_type:complete
MNPWVGDQVGLERIMNQFHQLLKTLFFFVFKNLQRDQLTEAVVTGVSAAVDGIFNAVAKPFNNISQAVWSSSHSRSDS